MKKIFVSLSLLICATTCYSQFKQGSLLIGGSVAGSFSSRTDKSNGGSTNRGSFSSLSITPRAGYFIIDNLAIGAGLGYTRNTFSATGSPSNLTMKNETYTFSPFARYYIGKIFFSAQYNFGRTKSGETDDYIKYNTNGYSLGVGYAILLNKHVALEPFAGYNRQAGRVQGSSVKTVTSGLLLQLGVQVYLHR